MTRVGVIVTNSEMKDSFSKRHNCRVLDCDPMDFNSISDAIDRAEPDTIIVCQGSPHLSGITTNHFGFIVRGFTKVLDAFEGNVVFVSTENIFSGKSPSFLFSGYREQDKPNPEDDCGRVFSAAEEIVNWRITRGKTLIVRRSSLYTKEDFGAMRNGIYNASQDLISSPMYLDHFTSAVVDIADKMDMLPYDVRVLNVAGLRLSNKAVWDMFRSVVKVDAKPQLTKNGVVRRGLDTALFDKIRVKLSLGNYELRNGIKSWAQDRQLDQS